MPDTFDFLREDDIAAAVENAENAYERRLNETAAEICSNGKVKLVAIAGPSSSGKTTSTKKLVKKLKMHGIESAVISIDDFFFTPDAESLKMDGKTDFESLDCIDLEMLHNCLGNLTRGMPAEIPIFDFAKKCRLDDTVILTPGKNQVFLVEGLHALNPKIYADSVKEDRTYKIYLNTFEKDGGMFETARLLRRIVRDYHFRSASAEFTLYLWDSVMRGERNNITPFIESADAKINTYFEYEAGVLKPYALKALGEVEKTSRYYGAARSLIEELESVTAVSEKFVPEDSLLREFIGR